MAALGIAFILLSLFHASISDQDCHAQVVVTTQTELKHQIRAEINYALQSSINATEHVAETCLTETSARELKIMLSNISRRLDAIEKKIDRSEVGSRPSSCAEILEINSASQSGYYLVGNSSHVYCDMTRSCGGVTGGWMRVAHLDMTNSSHQCPSGLRQRTDSSVRSCAAISSSATCSAVLHTSHGIQYTRVCGKITAYHGGTLDAFDNLRPQTGVRRYTINSNYVDGISLTHGQLPRQHIWTFAAGGWCPAHTPPPAFVGNDYFYDLDISEPINLSNPLWDGENCRNACCRLNTPPWFHKQLPQPTTAPIEMRVCRDQERENEDLAIKTIDIYVQ